MSKTVRTYVVCDGYGRELTEPVADFALACAWLRRLRRENPGEFYHIEDRTAEVEP